MVRRIEEAADGIVPGREALGEWVADHQEGPNRRERQDGDQDGEQDNCDDGQAYDDINKECILECNDDQFDVLVDNVEDMIRDVRGEEDKMMEAELCIYMQFVVDLKKNFLSPL